MLANIRVWQIVAFGAVATLTFAINAAVTGRSQQFVSSPAVSIATMTGESAEVTLPDFGPSPAEQAAGGTTSSADSDTDPNTFFVSSVFGDDSGEGQTAEAPWFSLQAAIDRLQPGQTLYVMDGLYSELKEPGNAHYVVSVDGTAQAWIRIAAAPGQRPELVADDGNGMMIRGQYVEVSGLTVRGEGFGVDNPYGWGLYVRQTHHVRVLDNTVFDMPVGGITAVEASNVEIYDNEVFDNSFWGTEQGSGISVWHSKDHGFGPSADGYHDKIIGNVVYRNENKVYSRWAPNQNIITDGNGIIIDESKDTGFTGRTLVANNVIFDNGGRAVIVNRASRVDIVSNTTYYNARTPDLAGGAVELAAVRSFDVRIMNNLAWSRPGRPAVQVKEMESVVIGGNVFVTDTPNGLETALDLVTNEDPGLVAPNIDPAVADFRPRPDSIVLDRGIDTEPRVSFDADGFARAVSAPDVGAYELRPR